MELGKSKVSIIIPVYNREKLIRETLKSAVEQTYENFEVVAVDNNSSDATYDILKEFAEKYPTVKVYQNSENIGPVLNWRKCLDYSTGEYIKILWSDDLMNANFLSKTVPYLEGNKNIGFVFTATEIFNNDTGYREEAYLIGNTGIYNTADFIEKSLGNSVFLVSPGNALFRTKDMLNNLLIDVPNKIGSDFKMHAIGNDLLIYLLTAKDYPKFAFVNEKLSFFRAHSDSITVSAKSSELELLYNLARIYFVDNFVETIELRKKFNTLMYIYFFSRISKYKFDKSMNIKTAKNFYFFTDKFQMNYGYLAKVLLDKYISKMKHWFARYCKKCRL